MTWLEQAEVVITTGSKRALGKGSFTYVAASAFRIIAQHSAPAHELTISDPKI
jgi:hypothetical protein